MKAIKPFEPSQDDVTLHSMQNQATEMLSSEFFLLLRIRRFILNLALGVLLDADPKIKTCRSHLLNASWSGGGKGGQGPGIGRLDQGKGEANDGSTLDRHPTVSSVLSAWTK